MGRFFSSIEQAMQCMRSYLVYQSTYMQVGYVQESLEVVAEVPTCIEGQRGGFAKLIYLLYYWPRQVVILKCDPLEPPSIQHQDSIPSLNLDSWGRYR